MVEKKEYRLLREIVIPIDNYVKVTNKRRPKPYEKGKCILPKRFYDKSTGELKEEYFWNPKGYLSNNDGTVLIKNSRSVNKPRFVKINGQGIYNGSISKSSRNVFVRAMHNQLALYLKNIEPLQDIENYPLGLTLLFYTMDRGIHNIDNDNRWIWDKVIQDTMVECKIIPDDNCYVIWENTKKTILVPTEEEEKLTIQIYGYA